MTDSGYYNTYNASYYFKTADAIQIKKSAALIFGNVQKLNRRFSLEIYSGFGLKYYTVTHQNTVLLRALEERYGGKFHNGSSNFEGDATGLYLPLGMTLSYRIK